MNTSGDQVATAGEMREAVGVLTYLDQVERDRAAARTPVWSECTRSVEHTENE